MARSSSGFVAGLTAAAVAVVGFLAYEASANAPDFLDRPHSDASKSPGAGGAKAPPPKKDPKALPAASGIGVRVVYQLGTDRVWLVDAEDTVRRTFTVQPSTVDPVPGEFKVTSRSGAVTGSDGVPIEHVVRFALTDGVSIGFSAAVDGSTPAPDPEQKTGGIRETREDATAMWEFAGIGRKIVVIP